jgi:dynein heavy chain
LQVAIAVPFPEGKLVYDYVFDPARMKWGPWLDRLEPKAVADSDADYSSIIVPTVDTLRYTFLLDALARHHHNCLFVGPTGTGKTVLVKRHLQTGLPQDAFTSTVVTCSAQTSANITQVGWAWHLQCAANVCSVTGLWVSLLTQAHGSCMPAHSV